MLNVAFRRTNWNLSGYFTGRRDDYPFTGLTVNRATRASISAASYNVSHGVSFYGRIANLADKKISGCPGLPALGTQISRWREVHHPPGVRHTCRKSPILLERRKRQRDGASYAAVGGRISRHALLTTVTEDTTASAMHGVRRVLLERRPRQSACRSTRS